MDNTCCLLVIDYKKGASKGRKVFRNIDIDIDLEDKIKNDFKGRNFVKMSFTFSQTGSTIYLVFVSSAMKLYML